MGKIPTTIIQLKDVLGWDKKSSSIIEEEFGYKKYPFSVLHSGTSRLLLNGAKIVVNKTNTLFEAKVVSFKEKGGIVIFSVDVNIGGDTSTFLQRVKTWLHHTLSSYQNRLLRYKKIQKVIDKYRTPEEGVGFSIGQYFRGKYISPNGVSYDERSLSVQIVGISSELLEMIAAGLAEEFQQETVLVNDYATNEWYLENKE